MPSLLVPVTDSGAVGDTWALFDLKGSQRMGDG